MKHLVILLLALILPSRLYAVFVGSISPAQGPICASAFPIQFGGSNLIAGTYTVTLTDSLNNQTGPVAPPTVDPNGRYVNAIFPIGALGASGAGTATITTPGNLTYNFPFTITACPAGPGVQVRLFGVATTSPVRVWQYVVSVINFGPGASVPTTVQVDGLPVAPGLALGLPPGAGSAVSPPPPVGQQGFSVSVGALGVGETADFVFEFTPDVSIVGTTFPLAAHFTSAYTGADALPVTVVASKDPNDKSGPPGAGAGHYIQTTKTLRFQVTFENDPSALAPAQRVVITDQLDPAKVDFGSVLFGPVLFGSQLLPPPPIGVNPFQVTVPYDVNSTPGDPSDDVNVLVSYSFDLVPASPSYGQLRWTFQTLDPATGVPPLSPFMGFLPPNVAPPAGQGSVSFSAQPLLNLPGGTVITNRANIIFDVNAPLPTSTWTNTIYPPATNHCCDGCVQPYASSYILYAYGTTNYWVNNLCHGTNNTVSALFPSAPNGAKIQKFNVYAQAWETATFDANTGLWDNADLELAPGEGFLYITPNYNSFMVQGCDPICSLPSAPTNGCQLVGRKGATSATWADLFDGPPACGTRLTLHDLNSGAPTDYDFVNGAWTPSDPVLAVGQSAMVCVLQNTNCGICTNQLAIQCGSGNLIFTNGVDQGYINGRWECGLVLTYAPPTVISGCATNFSCSPPSGSFFPVGVTTVTCTASNENSTAQCSFTITIVDGTPPKVTCPADKIVAANTSWHFDAPGTVDLCCGTNVTITGFVDTTSGSSITRTWSVVDCHGNPATGAQTVTVLSNDLPCLTFIHINTGADSNGTLLPPGAPDQNFVNLAAPGVPHTPVVIDPIHYAWVWSQPDGQSQWIGPEESAFGPTGWYTNRWSFILPCPNARLIGQVSTDDEGLLFVNGNSVTPPGMYGFGFQGVSTGSNFVAGLNTIDLVVHQGYGSTGFRAELEVVSDCCSNSCVLGVHPPDLVTICAATNGCGTMLDARSQVGITFSLGGAASVSQSIPIGTLLCRDTNVIFTISNPCGAITNVSVPVVVITNSPVMSLSTNRFKICVDSNGCGVLGDVRYLVNANYPYGVVQDPPYGTMICVGTNLGFATNVTFTSTNPCGGMVITNAIGFVGICCDPPPTNMVLWLTFDEATGATCYNSAGVNRGTRSDSGYKAVKAPAAAPTRVSGQYVNNCLCFNGNSFVRLASYANLAMGTHDFSIDAWVKWTNSAGPVQVILMKESTGSPYIYAPPIKYYGYGLYLNNGSPTFEMYSGTSTPGFVVSGPSLTLNTWTHLAVTVSRGSPKVATIYKNGVPVASHVIPAGFSGSIDDPALDRYSGGPAPTQTPSVTIGAASYATSNFFKGCLDEIEVFRRVLTPGDVMNLYLAKTQGKCRPTLGLPPLYICPSSKTVVATATMCNNGSDSRSYRLDFTPVNSADVPGVIDWKGPAPSTGYIVPKSQIVTVLPGQCVNLAITINLPSTFKSTSTAAYQMTVTDLTTTDSSTLLSYITADTSLCSFTPSRPGGFTSVFVHGTVSTNVLFGITNAYGGAATFNAQILAMNNNFQLDTNFVSLNGLPPGTPVNFTVPIPSAGQTNIGVAVSYVDSSVLQPYYLLCLVNNGAGGPLLPSDSVTLINTFRPTEGPALFIDATNGHPVVSWDAINYNWLLESSATLQGTPWTAVPQSVGVLPDGSQGVSIQPSNTSLFFRLRQ